MPGMSGLDFLKACRAQAPTQSVPFLLVTAESEQKNIIEAAKAGVSDYVVKPFNATTLKEKLTRAWNKHNKKAA